MDSTPTLSFVMLYVSDMDAALTYFTETLGFERAPEEDTPIFRSLRGGPGGCAFAIRQVTPDSAPAGAVELYFSTSDIEALREAWSRRGGETGPIAQRPFGRIFSVAAPDGHLLTAMG